MKSDKTVVRVYGRWNSSQYYVAIPGRPTKLTLTHDYDAPIPLPAPPGLGDIVQIIALSPICCLGPLAPSSQRYKYYAYDPQLVGRIIGIRSEPDGGVVFAVENEREVSAVGLVVLAIPPAPGASPQPAEDEYCPRPWLWEVLTKERCRRKLEADALVLDDLGPEVTPVPVLRMQSQKKRPDKRVWRPWLV